jgi:DNA-binding response OmpR family regulator
MPDMDGLEACRRIREEERLQHLPVIIVTAKTDSSDLTAAYTAGATDYIRKPVIPAELVARVSMAMSVKEEFDNRTERERELDAKTRELGHAVQELKTLRGTLCVCAKCKKVKTSTGLWQRLEDYLEEKLNAKITSGVCTKCGSESSSRPPRS